MFQGSGYDHDEYGYDTDHYRYRDYYPYIGYDYSGHYGYSYAAPYDHGYDYGFLGHTGPGFYTFKGDKDDFIYGKKNKVNQALAKPFPEGVASSSYDSRNVYGSPKIESECTLQRPDKFH